MTLNREVFLEDPTIRTIPNDGVAKVFDPGTPEELTVLRYELESFVCDGEYQSGLERILATFLDHLNRPTQPAVWVSGFYGSGKSHLMRVLEYLWRDIRFSDGATARGLSRLPESVTVLLKELTTAGRRHGGLWSAAGTLTAGAGSVRLALLAILFGSASLPKEYAPARFVIWLKKKGFYEAMRAGIEAQGEDFDLELRNMYVSTVLAQSLLDVSPGLATDTAGVLTLLAAQYPPDKIEITDDEFLRAVGDVLALQSNAPGKLPCTLVIFDELQQFIGEDSDRTSQVQNIVEACSSRFGSHLLFVGTGQSAIQATPQLSKLQHRFTVGVELSDTDVERVVREVVLRKNQAQVPELQAMLDNARGEIDRHLAGTRIGARMADAPDLVPDYPLLPVRRRFWERVLRAVDKAGAAGQLRTQLRIVHEAARVVANQQIGTVVSGGFIHNQLRSGMLQSSVLLRDMDRAIEEQKDGTPEGLLRARLCATIFLIGKLPTEGIAATGIRADAATLADLLVEDLTAGSAALRQHIPELLQGLVESGTLMLVDGEYRLQTRESAEWEADYRARFARIQADDARIAGDRATEFRTAIGGALKGLTHIHGTNKVVRKFDLYIGTDTVPPTTVNVPIWVRDEWSVSERAVREEAQAAGVESPVIFVFLSKRDAEGLKSALASVAAAKESLESRPLPTTPEGLEARGAMESRLKIERARLNTLIGNILDSARVFQGGGNEIAEGSLAASVRAAMEASVARLFPEFAAADIAGWGTVVKRAGEGAADALMALGYHGDVDKHPVCQKVRAFIGNVGKKGAEIRKTFTGVGYGWPQDSVDGALLALLAGGYVRAARNGQPLGVKEIAQSQIGVIDFVSEGVTVSSAQKIAVRKLISDLGLPVKPGEEAAAFPIILERLGQLAATAGGDPPLPKRPSIDTVEHLRSLSGNDQFVAVYERRDELLTDFRTWTRAKELIEQRTPRWQMLQRLLTHASGLPEAADVSSQVEAICAARSLLAEPDPVAPLLGVLTTSLRKALQEARWRLVQVRQRELEALETTVEWKRLPRDDCARLVTAYSLGEIPEVSVGTDQALLRSLDAAPLAQWENRIAAFPGRVAAAREEAARLLEPKAVRVNLPKATLKSAADVDAYLETLRAEIIAHIEAGHPVIV